MPHLEGACEHIWRSVDDPAPEGRSRQKAFQERGIKSAQFKFYHNAVKREQKSCKDFFFETKVQSMKEEVERG